MGDTVKVNGSLELMVTEPKVPHNKHTVQIETEWKVPKV